MTRSRTAATRFSCGPRWEDGKTADRGSLVLRDLFVTNCVASGSGGGLYAIYGVLATNCTFVGNTSTDGGGAFASTDWYRRVATSSHFAYCPRFYCCEFLSNKLSANGKCGGGFRNDWSALVDHCVFRKNNAPSGYGGGLYAGYYARVYDSQFIANKGASYGCNMNCGGGDAGGFLSRCLFTGAASGFGSVWAGGSWTLDNSVFSNNTVEAIYGTGTPTLRSCLIAGSVQIFQSTVKAENCTIAGDINYRSDSKGVFIAHNSILAGSVTFNNLANKKSLFCATNCSIQATVPSGNANTAQALPDFGCYEAQKPVPATGVVFLK